MVPVAERDGVVLAQLLLSVQVAGRAVMDADRPARLAVAPQVARRAAVGALGILVAFVGDPMAR